MSTKRARRRRHGRQTTGRVAQLEATIARLVRAVVALEVRVYPLRTAVVGEGMCRAAVMPPSLPEEGSGGT